MSIRFKINNVEVTAQPGENLIDVARRTGFDIPSLCHKESLPPIGACRICLVEITRRGRTELTTACNYEVLEGIEVNTESMEVTEQRRMNLELLLSRAPNAGPLKELAARYGVTRSRFGAPAFDPLPNCILCELCVRTCAHLGHHALTVVGRGDKKRIGLPFNQPAETCVGCAACAAVCPTGCIPVKESSKDRTIWGQVHPFVRCRVCGEPVITEKHRAHALKVNPLPEEYYELCESCKQASTSRRFAEIVW
jgi:bidirectional [NiFe] hydrogenase diaphorase subunit